MSSISRTAPRLLAILVLCLGAALTPAGAASEKAPPEGLSCETLGWLRAVLGVDAAATDPESRHRRYALFASVDMRGIARELSTRLTSGETKTVISFLQATDPRSSARPASLYSVRKLSGALIGALDCDPEARPRQPDGSSVGAFGVPEAPSALDRIFGAVRIHAAALGRAIWLLPLVPLIAAAAVVLLRTLARGKPSARYLCSIAVELEVAGSRLSATMADVSSTGCKLVIATPPPSGSPVTLRAPGLTRAATVTWSTISAAGVAFDAPLDRPAIDALIAHSTLDRSAAPAPDPEAGSLAAP